MRPYRPRRSSIRWMENAPKMVLACYDSGPNKGDDRYTVLYDIAFLERNGWEVHARAMSENPFHPCGIGLYISVPPSPRNRFGRKIKFTDLPEPCQRLVRQDCEDTP